MRESVLNYLKIRDLFSHLNVPTVLAKNLDDGFIVLNDLGRHPIPKSHANAPQ